MSPIVEKILIQVLKGLINDATIEEAKQAVLVFAKSLTEKTETELDDYLVEVLAKVLEA